MRVIAACARQIRSDGRPVTTLAVVTGSAHRAWWSREADEVLDLGPHAEIEPTVLVGALSARGVDAVWFGALPGHPGPTTDLSLLADHVAACEDAGLLVIGPASEVLRSLADDGSLPRLADAAGVRLATEKATGPLLSVDLLRDREGRVWSLGVRDTVTTPEGLTVLSEYPASDLSEEITHTVVTAGRALITAAGLVGAAVARFRVDEHGVGCVAFTPSGRPEHALVEESSGVSMLPMPKPLTEATAPAISPAMAMSVKNATSDIIISHWTGHLVGPQQSAVPFFPQEQPAGRCQRNPFPFRTCRSLRGTGHQRGQRCRASNRTRIAQSA